VGTPSTTSVLRSPATRRRRGSAELIETTGGGLRIAEIGVVVFLGLLVSPPLLILAVVVAVPVIAISAVGAAAVAPSPCRPGSRPGSAPTTAHRSTLFLHRLRL
jgi:hypothetical protein